MSDEIIPPEPRRSITNPFGGGVAVRPAGALAQAEQQKVVAEVQARIMIARSFPRDPIKAMDLILIDCTRPTLAKKALYEYARGGTAISGPSIRLAEAIAQRWGNIASGVKEISRANGYSECVAYAFDMESGFYDERQFQVRHWRDTKQGGYQLTDERDIYEIISNNGARRKRAAMLTVIPGDVVEAAVEQCEETLAATADTSPEALTRMVEAFLDFGVTREQIEKRIQRRIEAIRPAQVIQLSKIYASLNDEMSKAADWFEVEGAGGGGIWGAVDAAHAAQEGNGAQPTQTTRRSSRKAPAKEAAGQPSNPAGNGTTKQGAEQGGPDPQTNIGQSAPARTAGETPATDKGTSASAGSETRTESRDAGAAVGTSAPAGQTTQQTNSAGAAFSVWLVDGDGVAVDGTDAFDDPVAYATAYAKVYADMFPPERKPFERANAEGLEQAFALNPEGVQTALAPPKPPAAAAEEVKGTPELPLNAPHDDAVIPRAAKPTRAAFTGFNLALKEKAATITTDDALNHLVAVNADSISAMPNAFRLEAVGIIEGRRKEIAAPPPAPTAQSNGAAAAPDIAADLLGDVQSLESAESITTWLGMPRIKALISGVQSTDRPGWLRVMTAANGAYIRMLVKACTTQAACEMVENDEMVNLAMEWLNRNAGPEFDSVVTYAREYKATLPA